MMYAIVSLLAANLLLTLVTLSGVGLVKDRLDALEGPNDPIPDAEG